MYVQGNFYGNWNIWKFEVQFIWKCNDSKFQPDNLSGFLTGYIENSIFLRQQRWPIDFKLILSKKKFKVIKNVAVYRDLLKNHCQNPFWIL